MVNTYLKLRVIIIISIALGLDLWTRTQVGPGQSPWQIRFGIYTNSGLAEHALGVIKFSSDKLVIRVKIM